MKDIKVKMNYDVSDFEEKAKKLMENIREESPEILKRTVVVFANAAARFTPPLNGNKNTIPKEKYYRPFVNLLGLVQGKYPRNDSYAD